MRASPAIIYVALATMLFGCKSGRDINSQTGQPVVSVGKQFRMFQIMSKRSGVAITPGIDIFADGRCMIRTFDGKELERKLSPSVVRDLVAFFEQQGLFQISDESIERAIKHGQEPVIVELPDGGFSVSSKGPLVVADSSYTRIAVRTPSKSVVLTRYALDAEIDHFDTVTELETVKQCVRRVYEVAGIID